AVRCDNVRGHRSRGSRCGPWSHRGEYRKGSLVEAAVLLMEQWIRSHDQRFVRKFGR
ncbi:unnamed protein product, partial [Amoebophrya sp. A25]